MSNFAKLSAALGLKFGPVRQGVTPKKILEYVLNDLVMIEADTRLVSDPDIMSKYEGMKTAYKDVAHFIAPFHQAPITESVKELADAARK